MRKSDHDFVDVVTTNKTRKTEEHVKLPSVEEVSVRLLEMQVSDATKTRKASLSQLANFSSCKRDDPTYHGEFSFMAAGTSGIPGLVSLFGSGLFDPVNTWGKFRRLAKRVPTVEDMRHICKYLNAPEMSGVVSKEADEKSSSPLQELLKCESSKTDPVVHAIFSFAAQFSKSKLKELLFRYDEVDKFAAESLIHALESRYADDVYEVDEGIVTYTSSDEGATRCISLPTWTDPNPRPFVRCAFKLLQRYAEHYEYLALDDNEREKYAERCRRPPPFSMVMPNYYQLYEHLTHIDEVTSTKRMAANDIASLTAYVPEYDIFHDNPTISQLSQGCMSVPMRIITGQACCGKTHVLDRLGERGLKHFSRGKMGTFSGKSKDPSTIASLHEAMEIMLRRTNVLGDRGPIDNPLWSKIMPLTNPKYESRIVRCLFNWFKANFNEAVVAYNRSLRVVVFLDPFFDQCKMRMRKRNRKGDAQRSRIKNYNRAQFMAYYFCARIFNWPVVLVPYKFEDEKWQFSPEGYGIIEEFVFQYFNWFPRSKTDAPQVPPVSVCGDPYGPTSLSEYESEANEYPRSVGIFK